MSTIDLYLSKYGKYTAPTATGTVTITGHERWVDQYIITKTLRFPTTNTAPMDIHGVSILRQMGRRIIAIST